MPTMPPAHRPAPKRKHNWQHNKSTTARGYGYKWQQLRARILKRDGHLCQVCKRVQAAQVDHIQPKAFGGGDNPENLQAICEGCHKAKTARDKG